MATPEELSQIREVLEVILFGGSSPAAKNFPELAARVPMSRRSPAMTGDPTFGDDGRLERPSLDATPTLVLNRADLVGELSVDGDVPPTLSLEDLAGHLVATAEGSTPLADGDALVDLCAFEGVRVEETSDGVEVELRWCAEYPPGALPGRAAPNAVVRPFVDRSQPFVCAVECMERLAQALGEETARELQLSHSVSIETFKAIDATR